MDLVWWKKITNASRFLNLITEGVQEGCCIMLQLPDTVPWHFTMIDILSEELENQNSNRVLVRTRDTGTDPGEYLFQNYCRKEKRVQYRPGIGYAKFLAESSEIALNNYILWIVADSDEQAKNWYTFIQSYNKSLGKSRNGCIFIIETESKQSFRDQGRIRVIAYQKEIEYYDCYLFNMLAAASLKESAIFKQYLTEAVTLVIPNDVELSAECIKRGRAFLEDPAKTVREIIESEIRCEGQKFVFEVSEKQMQERIWEAQIKVVFPVVEKKRSGLINKYRKYIEGLLPVTGAYGEVVYEAEAVEIGMISHLVTSGKLQVSSEDAKVISKLRNARNVLAHVRILSQKEIDEIFVL